MKGSAAQIFEATTLYQGGAHLSLWTVACGCGAIASRARSDRDPPSRLARHFRAQGWEVGHKVGHHTCPTCLNSKRRRHLRVVKTEESPVVQSALPKSIQLPPVVSSGGEPPTANPPPSPTIAQRRAVLDELEASYDVTAGRYTGRLDDAALASKLNMPSAWIAKLRDELFGPERNEAAAIKQAKLAELEKRADEMAARMVDMDAALTRLRAEIAEARR